MSNKKIIYIFLIFLFLTINACRGKGGKTVFICNGPNSHAYHLKENCIGLRNCSTELTKIPLDSAKELGRDFCGYEE